MEKDRYNKLNSYLKEKYGERTLKICIDGNFTCPNRDGTKSNTGCIFCSKYGSGEHIKEFIKKTSNDPRILQEYNSKNSANLNSIYFTEKYIKFQIENYFKSYKATRANKFIAYFQNYSNTYDSISNLKIKYDSALSDSRIICLDIATRPDCINEEICMLLASYKNKYDVWVELGLQTSNEVTGKSLNRCYSNSDFSNAVKLLNKYNIEVITHIMIGLPNEKKSDIDNTINFVNSHNIQGIKIHSTYIVKGTKLEELYNNGQYFPISLEEYIKNACYILTHINPNIIIHKISGDAPKDLLIAPKWNLHKKWIINGIDRYLREKDLYQGMYYKPTK